LAYRRPALVAHGDHDALAGLFVRARFPRSAHCIFSQAGTIYGANTSAYQRKRQRSSLSLKDEAAERLLRLAPTQRTAKGINANHVSRFAIFDPK
jgi:hypothetical protein